MGKSENGNISESYKVTANNWQSWSRQHLICGSLTSKLSS